MIGATSPIREPEVGQVWIDGEITMVVIEVTDATVKIKAANDDGPFRYTIIPRSQWPLRRLVYVGKP